MLFDRGSTILATRRTKQDFGQNVAPEALERVRLEGWGCEPEVCGAGWIMSCEREAAEKAGSVG